MVIKQEPEGKEEAMLCPCYARLREEGREMVGFKTLLARHCR